MIVSMTGYGKAESQLSNRCLSVEIRGLNSKQLDLNTRIALELRDCEHEIRQIVTQRLERGKIDVKVELLTNNNTLFATHLTEDIGSTIHNLMTLLDAGLTPFSCISVCTSISSRPSASRTSMLTGSEVASVIIQPRSA